MPPIEAELHDGTILEFPDGTSQDVVDATVKRHLGIEKPAAAPVRDDFSGQSNMPGDPIRPRASQADVRAVDQAALRAESERSRAAPSAVELERAAQPARIAFKDGQRPALAPADFSQNHEKTSPPVRFDPEGDGYDYEGARAAMLEPDETGHWPSRDPFTGVLLKGRKHPTWQMTEQGERETGHEIYQRGGRWYSHPPQEPSAPPPAGSSMALEGFTTEPAAEDEPGEFRKGAAAGTIGARQLGVAALTIPALGAMQTLASELNAYDRIDRENQFAIPKGADYVTGKARMYLASPPETRTRLRQQALERLQGHGEVKDQLVGLWRAYADEQRQYAGKTVDFTNVKDVASFSDWFAWNTGQGLPYMAGSALMGILGGVLGGPGGATLGVLGSGYGMGVGDIQGEGIEKDLHLGETGRAALVGGLPYGALDVTLGPIARALRMVSRPTLENVAKQYWKRAGKEVLTNSVGEFLNEAGQEIIKDASIGSVTGEPIVTDASLLRWFNAGMAGAATGAPTGAITAIPGPPANSVRIKPDETSAPHDLRVAGKEAGLDRNQADFVANRQESATSSDAVQPGVTSPGQPAGDHLDGRVEPTIRPGDLERVVADNRPAREIIAEEEREAAATAVEPTATAVQADEEERTARADELGLPHVGDRMTVDAAAGAVTGVVESASPTEEGWELRIRDDEGELHVFTESDRIQVSTPARRGDGTREDPVRVTASAQIAHARAQIDPDPTPGQKDAENFSMGHVRFDEGHAFHGLPDISLETAKGGTRTAKDGSWSVPNFPADYGRFKGTEGMDGDHVDVMLGAGGKVFIIDQINAETGAADEHKVMLGYPTAKAARDVYIAAFTDGKGAERIGAINAISIGELDAWLRDSKRTKRPYGEISTAEEWLEDVRGDWNHEQPLAGYAEDLEHDLKHASDPGWRPAMREALRQLRARIRKLQLGEGAVDESNDEGQVRGARPAGEGGREQGGADQQRAKEAPAAAGAGRALEQRHEPAQPRKGEVLESAEDRKRWTTYQLGSNARARAAGVKPIAPYVVDANGVRLRKAQRKGKLAEGETLVWGFDQAQALRTKRLKAYWQARRRPDRTRDSLIEWVAKRGGMSMEEREDTVPGENRVFNVSQWFFTKDGAAADELATRAFEDGYLSNAEYEDVDGGVQALRDKIADEFAGRRKHFSTWKTTTADEIRESEEEEVILAATALGIDYVGKKIAEIRKLIQEAEAVEQAIVEVDADKQAGLERDAVKADNLTPLEAPDGETGSQPAEPGPGARQAAPARRQPGAARQAVPEDAAEVAPAAGGPADADRGAGAQGPVETEAEREARLEREAIQGEDDPLESRGRRGPRDMPREWLDALRNERAPTDEETIRQARELIRIIDEITPRYWSIGSTTGYRIVQNERAQLERELAAGDAAAIRYRWWHRTHASRALALRESIKAAEGYAKRDAERRYQVELYPPADKPNDPVRLTAHALRRGDKAAIERVAKQMAKGLPWDAVLIPIPGHGGRAEATVRLAQAIAEAARQHQVKLGHKHFRIPVVDILRGDRREPQYWVKKSGEKPLAGAAFGFRHVANVPKGQIFLVDNVIGTGETMKAATKAIGVPALPLVYAAEPGAIWTPDTEDGPQASRGGRKADMEERLAGVRVYAPQSSPSTGRELMQPADNTRATSWDQIRWVEEFHDYFAAEIKALRVLILKRPVEENPNNGEPIRDLPPFRVLIAGTAAHLPNHGAAETFDDAKRLAFDGASLELPMELLTADRQHTGRTARPGASSKVPRSKGREVERAPPDELEEDALDEGLDAPITEEERQRAAADLEDDDAQASQGGRRGAGYEGAIDALNGYMQRAEESGDFEDLRWRIEVPGESIYKIKKIAVVIESMEAAKPRSGAGRRLLQGLKAVIVIPEEIDGDVAWKFWEQMAKEGLAAGKFFLDEQPPAEEKIPEWAAGESGDHLFMPLNAEYYDAFKSGAKDTEYRVYGKKWNERTARPGRRVLLSRGYGKQDRIWGKVVDFKRGAPPADPAWKKIYGDEQDAAHIKIELEAKPAAARDETPTPTSTEALALADLRNALRRHQDPDEGEDITAMDLLEFVEAMDEVPEAVTAAAKAYRQAITEDREEFGMRSGVEDGPEHKQFIKAVEMAVAAERSAAAPSIEKAKTDMVTVPEDSSAKVTTPKPDGSQGRLFESRGRKFNAQRDGRWTGVPIAGEISWSEGKHGEPWTGSIGGRQVAQITRVGERYRIDIDGWAFNEPVVFVNPQRAQIVARQILAAAPQTRAPRADLATQVEDLERRVDQAYERDDPGAEDLDAELAELREKLASGAEQDAGERELEQDAEADQVVAGGTVYERTEDGPVLVARDVAIVQPSRWDPGPTTYDFYMHTILDTKTGKDIGRVTLGWRDGKVMVLPQITLWEGSQGHWRGKGRGEAVIRAILEHNGEGNELIAAHISDAAMGFWRKMGANVYDTGEGKDGSLTLESYRDARDSGEGEGAPRSAEAGAGQPQDSRAREAGAEETPGLRPSRIAELLVEAFGPGVQALLDSGFLSIAATPAQLPAVLRKRTGEQTEAWYDRKGRGGEGQAWLIASQLDADRVVPVFLHEIGEHHGLERMLGKKGYETLQETVRNLAQTNAVVSLSWDHVAEHYPHLKVGGKRFVSEVIARVGETAEGRRLPFFRRLINAVREFLIKLGLQAGLVSKISDEDILALIQAAARRVVEDAAAAAQEPVAYPAAASEGATDAQASRGILGKLFGKEPIPAGQEPQVGDNIEAQPGAEFKRLNQLLGAKLYGEPRDLPVVSVKEMLQNAFDAIKTVIDNGSATMGAIDIEVDRGARTITVQDNGSGMTPHTLANAFLRIAGTLKETDRSSGGLGIAKGLFLYGNRRIRVETMRDGKKAILDTSGADLLAAADGTGGKPQIQIKSAPEGLHGTTVKIWVPADYVDPARGRTVDIYMSEMAADYPVLQRSPLFSNIAVRFNGKNLPNIGRNFDAHEYSVFANVKFNWGDATVYVSKKELAKSYAAPNVHNLSNGLWQFSLYLAADPLSVGEGVPREIYVDVHPRVQPEDPGYPFSLNRQDFTGQTKADFDKLLQYLALAYRREVADAGAQNFGQIRYLSGGKLGDKQRLAPKRDKDFAKGLLRVVEGDTVEIEEGRLTVNGRVIPKLTAKELNEAKISIKDFTIPQTEIQHDKVMLHDNLQRDGVPFSELMREKFGREFDRVMEGIGERFMNLRELFVEQYPQKYLGLADYAVGISFDKAYHGVMTAIPFKGVFVNPAGLTGVKDEVLANEIFGTMVHELVHHKEKGHGPEFINELQRMYAEILSSDHGESVRREMVGFITHNAAHIKAIAEEFKNENLSPVGNTLEGREQTRDAGPGASASSAVDRGARDQAAGGRGAPGELGVDRDLPGPGEAAGDVEDEPQASQGGASNLPPPAPDQFQLTALDTIESEPPNREPGDRQWVGDISLFTKLAIHPRMLASLEPTFVPVYRVAEAQVEDRDQIAHELAKRIQGYMALPEDSKNKVNAVLELDRLEEKVHLAGKEKRVKNERFRLARLSKVGDTITLSDEEKTAYWAVRRMLDVALKMFRDQLLAELGVDASKFKGGDLAAKILDAINPRMTEEQKANFEKAAKFAHEIEQARRRGYVPFTRWGNVVIAVKNADGDTIWAEKVEVDPIEFHKRGAAVRFGRQLRQMPSVKRALENVEKLFPRAAKVSVFQIPEGAGTAETHPDIGQLDELAKIGGIEPAEWDGVRAKLEQALKAKGFRKHFLGSANVPGYSADFERAVADYVTGMAGYLARRKHREAWDTAIAGIPPVKRRLQGYARKYHEYMQSPQEELHLLRQMGFIWYLGMIPASAIANLTQVPLVSMPYLAQFANAAVVAGEITRAQADVAAMYRPVDTGFEMFDPAAAPEDVREALEAAWARGFFVPLQTYEVQGVAYGRTPYGRKAKRGLRDTRDGIAYLFSLAERTNRLTTFIAAHRIAARKGFQDRVYQVLGDNPLAKAELGREEWSPARFATWAVDETQFRMGKVNRPQIGRGYGAAILQFKGFMMQMLELWWRMASQNGVHGKTAFAASLLLWMLTAGFWGLPGAEDLRDLFEKLYRLFTHTSIDVRSRAREFVFKATGSAKIAEMFTRGVPAGVGFDLSGRVGMGNIAPDSPLQVAGIPGDIAAGRAMRAVEHAANDKPELAWAEALPNALRNLITGISWKAQGVRNNRGDVVVPKDQVGVTDAIMRGFVGVTPTWISNRRDLELAQRRVENAITEKRDDFYERMAKARADLIRAERKGDKAAAGEASKRIREQRQALSSYNEGRPLEERIVLNDKALEGRIARELKGSDANRGKGRVPARPRREQLRDVYGVK